MHEDCAELKVISNIDIYKKDYQIVTIVKLKKLDKYVQIEMINKLQF